MAGRYKTAILSQIETLEEIHKEAETTRALERTGEACGKGLRFHCCDNCRRPTVKYGQREGGIRESNVPLKKRKQRVTNDSINQKAKAGSFRGFHSRLSVTRDIFEMERVVKEIATAVQFNPRVWNDPYIAFLRTHNARIDKLRTPPLLVL